MQPYIILKKVIMFLNIIDHVIKCVMKKWDKKMCVLPPLFLDELEPSIQLERRRRKGLLLLLLFGSP